MIKIKRSPEFERWLNSLKDLKTVERINIRLARAQLGNFGDCKALGDGIYEMRLDFGAGIRIYYK